MIYKVSNTNFLQFEQSFFQELKSGQGKTEDKTKIIHQDNHEDKMEDEDDQNENGDEMEMETREMKSDYFTNHVHVGAGLSSLQVSIS